MENLKLLWFPIRKSGLIYYNHKIIHKIRILKFPRHGRQRRERRERDRYGTYVCFEAERIWMGSLIVMIMIGPVGVIVDGIIIVVGNSFKIEFHFT